MKYQYKIETGEVESVPVIYFEGDMTSDSDGDLKSVYARLKNEHNLTRLFINFEKTKYINSSGIATLISIIQDMNGRQGKIFFIGLSDHFKRIMDIVGLADFSIIADSVDDALKHLK